MKRPWVIVVAVLGARSMQAQDTLRIKADGAPAWGADVRLVEEYSVGDLNGPPEYALGSVSRVAVEPGGGFYTFDQSDIQIRHYDATGKFLNTIGRKGAGPAEYQDVAAMAVTADGLLLVFDPRNSRITYFQPDGKIRRAFQMMRTGFYGSGFILDNAGRTYLTVHVPGGPAEGPGARQQYLRYRGDRLIDSVPVPPFEFRRDAFWLSTTDGMRWNFTDHAIRVPYSGGGLLSANASAYRFVIDTGGKRVALVQRNAHPVPLGSEEREEWQAFAAFLTRNRATNRSYDIPRTKPLIRDLTSDHLGRIWVDVFVAAERRTNLPPRPPDRGPPVTWRERSTYDVFTGRGLYLGRVTLPQEGQLMAVRDDRIWVRTKGAEGEDRITVFRLRRGAGRPLG